MKTTKEKLFYFMTLIVLAIVAYRPLKECVKLILNVVTHSLTYRFADETLLIPYGGIVISLLVGFLLWPALHKLPPKKMTIILAIVSVAVLVGSSLVIEQTALNQWSIINEINQQDNQRSAEENRLTEESETIDDEDRAFASSFFSGDPIPFDAKQVVFLIDEVEVLATRTNEVVELKGYLEKSGISFYCEDGRAIYTSVLPTRRGRGIVRYVTEEGTIANFVREVNAAGETVVLMIGGKEVRAKTMPPNQAGVAFITEDGRKIFDNSLPEDAVLTTRMMPAPYVTKAGDRVYLVGKAEDSLQTEDRMTQEDVFQSGEMGINPSSYTITPAMKIHYYIFSALWVVMILLFLYYLGTFFDSSPERISVKDVTLQGLATLCFSLAYLFVRVMEYINYDKRLLTPPSVLSAVFCIVMAALSAGLFAGTFVEFSGKKKLIPPLASVLTVLAVYVGEYFMVGGQLYLYGESFFFQPLPVILVSPANIIVILVPAILVSFLLSWVNKTREKGATSKLPSAE